MRYPAALDKPGSDFTSIPTWADQNILQPSIWLTRCAAHVPLEAWIGRLQASQVERVLKRNSDLGACPRNHATRFLEIYDDDDSSMMSKSGLIGALDISK